MEVVLDNLEFEMENEGRNVAKDSPTFPTSWRGRKRARITSSLRFVWYFQPQSSDDGVIGGDDSVDGGDDGEDSVVRQVIVGICAMEKKSLSKPMREILSRLEEFEYLKTAIFPEDVILNVSVHWAGGRGLSLGSRRVACCTMILFSLPSFLPLLNNPNCRNPSKNGLFATASWPSTRRAFQ